MQLVFNKTEKNKAPFIPIKTVTRQPTITTKSLNNVTTYYTVALNK